MAVLGPSHGRQAIVGLDKAYWIKKKEGGKKEREASVKKLREYTHRPLQI